MKRILPAFLGIFLILFVGFLFLQRSHFASAATANHVVISEVQITGTNTVDEFVELYNPTTSNVDLTGWTLNKKTAAVGATETHVSTLSGSIPSHGFYLIANEGFDGGITPDTSYSTQSISANNSVYLRNAQNDLIDLLGLGTSASSETATIADPIDNRSVERKAFSTSLEVEMAAGGVNELMGNAEDTDNNSVDFVKHVSPNASTPQNSQSAIEPVGGATITPTTTPSASPTPTTIPFVTPTSTPTPSPTTSPTITPAPTMTVSPTPSTPTPTPKVIVRGPIFTCSLNYKVHRLFNFTILIPEVRCVRTSV